MPRLLALEWDESEARLAVATARGRTATIDELFAVDLRPAPGERPLEPAEIGSKIAAALAARGVGRVTTLVALGRANIELKRLSLPPAPEEELPELVRFQGLREFNTLGDDWPLDFVPLDEDDSEGRSVLAAAVAPKVVERIAATCEAAGLSARRIVLRPFAAAALLRRTAGGEQLRLLIDLLGDEADLTVLQGARVVFPRTVLLPGEPGSPTQTKALLTEIRRTIAAAQNQLGGRRIESINLCGSGDEPTELAGAIEADLSLPVQPFDPLADAPLSGPLRRHPPAQSERFAPLIGMLLDEAQGRAHDLDFLNPRRPPETANPRRRLYILGGLAAASIVAAIVLFNVLLAQEDSEILALRKKFAKQQEDLEVADATIKDVARIDKWIAEDAVWLDELRWLSENAPPADHAMVTSLDLFEDSRGGKISLGGLLDEQPTSEQLGKRLRDERHQMFPESDRDTDAAVHGLYNWEVKGTILVLNEDAQKAPPLPPLRRLAAPRAVTKGVR